MLAKYFLPDNLMLFVNTWLLIVNFKLIEW